MKTRFLALRLPHLRAQLAARLIPGLKNRSYAVVSGPGGRAQLLGLSAAAARAGLSTGLSVQQALRLQPTLQLVEESPGLLEDSRARLTRLLGEQAPEIRSSGVSDWLLDISGCGLLHPDELAQARDLIALLAEREQLSAAAGLGTTPLAARLLARRAATGCVHAASGSQERELLDGFPLEGLPGLPRPLLSQLAEAGIRRVAEARQLEAAEVLRVFGPSGRRLLESLDGLGFGGCKEPSRDQDWTVGRRLARDSSDPGELWSLISEQVEELLIRCREARVHPRRLTLRLGWSDGHSQLRGMRMQELPGESLRASLRATARRLLGQGLDARRFRVRALELRLQTRASREQIGLFPSPAPRHEEGLDRCIGQLRGRYGATALTVGFADWNLAG